MSCKLKFWEKESSFDVETANWMFSDAYAGAVKFLLMPVIVVFVMRKKKWIKSTRL